MSDKRRAVAIGVFDGMHLGHLAVINSAISLRETGLEPAVFTFSLSGSPKKGGMIITDEEKQRLLAKLGVDVVESPEFASFAGLDGESFVKERLIAGLGASAVCCGYDFRFGRGRSCGVDELRDICGRCGLELHVAAAVTDGGEPVSSSRVREALTEGDVKTANRLLGRSYSFELEVGHGRRLAGRLGFPTINQRWPEECVIPRFGVYASKVSVGGDIRAAVTNIGIKPTVAENGEDGVLAETYIEDYSGDLYGRMVRVELLDFMRPEKKFGSLEELRGQVLSDAKAAKLIATLGEGWKNG